MFLAIQCGFLVLSWGHKSYVLCRGSLELLCYWSFEWLWMWSSTIIQTFKFIFSGECIKTEVNLDLEYFKMVNVSVLRSAVVAEMSVRVYLFAYVSCYDFRWMCCPFVAYFKLPFRWLFCSEGRRRKWVFPQITEFCRSKVRYFKMMNHDSSPSLIS